MIEDEILKWQFKSGSPDALRRIYEKYLNYLLTLALALLNNKSIAQDLVHDVFVSFARSKVKFKLSGSLKSYLATCVVNRTRDYLRADIRQPLELDDNVTPVASNTDSPDTLVIGDEQSEILANAMAELPYDQREVITLHIMAGMKFSRIASLQGVSVNTVQGRYRYGLDKLRSILNSEVQNETH